MNTHQLAFEIPAPIEAMGATGLLTIDLGALDRNYRKLAALAAPGRTAAVVKANAYGLGAQCVAERLYEAGCRDFFVAQFLEAIPLRTSLDGDARIYVLNGLQPGNEVECATRGIVPVVNSYAQWSRWKLLARQLNRTLPAVLQFDSGMSRLGMPPDERESLAAEVIRTGEINILFIMSHLASADEPDSEQNDEQLAQMQVIESEFSGLDVSFANSAGLFLCEAFHGEVARPGLALYGGAPVSGKPNPMEAVASLQVAVVQTRTVAAGTKIGYSATHRATAPMRLATIAAGYADGLPRSLSGRGAVYFRGVRLPIVGRVSMDSITIDVSDLPEGSVGLGSLVEVIGPHQTLEMLAADAGTIAYEILTGLGQRYQRIYK